MDRTGLSVDSGGAVQPSVVPSKSPRTTSARAIVKKPMAKTKPTDANIEWARIFSSSFKRIMTSHFAPDETQHPGPLQSTACIPNFQEYSARPVNYPLTAG